MGAMESRGEEKAGFVAELEASRDAMGFESWGALQRKLKKTHTPMFFFLWLLRVLRLLFLGISAWEAVDLGVIDHCTGCFHEKHICE